MENEKEKAKDNLISGVDKFLEGIGNPEVQIKEARVDRVEFISYDANGEELQLMLTVDSDDLSVVVSDLKLGRIVCMSQDYLDAYSELLYVIIRYLKDLNKKM